MPCSSASCSVTINGWVAASGTGITVAKIVRVPRANSAEVNPITSSPANTLDTPDWQVAIYAYAFGAGLGFTMQTITTAIQNAVDRTDMGVATSSATFFRSMGGAIGTAVLGSVLSSRLTHYMAEEFRGIPLPKGGAGIDVNDVQAIQALPLPIKEHVLHAFTNAMDDVFLAGIPFAAIAIVVSLFLKEIPLATRDTAGPPAGVG